LAHGFEYKGERVSLVGPQGIFKPKICDYPLSITTVMHGPYADRIDSSGLLSYRYRGEDPNHRDNVGLREAWRRRLPVIYFFAIEKGRYVATYPVIIVGDDPAALTFKAQVDTLSKETPLGVGEYSDDAGSSRRLYLTAQVKVRLHQRAFRERVLRAYREQCAFCRLKHDELLDAAHIIADKEPEGEPVISNGVALCKLHHAAFDSHFIGIRPDCVLQVRHDILVEPDGPMHLYGLKAMHNQHLILPHALAHHPSMARLEQRWQLFLASK